MFSKDVKDRDGSEHKMTTRTLAHPRHTLSHPECARVKCETLKEKKRACLRHRQLVHDA